MFRENRSLNLISAAKKAKELGIEVVSFVGKDGGELAKISDTLIARQK